MCGKRHCENCADRGKCCADDIAKRMSGDECRKEKVKRREISAFYKGSLQVVASQLINVPACRRSVKSDSKRLTEETLARATNPHTPPQNENYLAVRRAVPWPTETLSIVLTPHPDGLLHTAASIHSLGHHAQMPLLSICPEARALEFDHVGASIFSWKGVRTKFLPSRYLVLLICFVLQRSFIVLGSTARVSLAA